MTSRNFRRQCNVTALTHISEYVHPSWVQSLSSPALTVYPSPHDVIVHANTTGRTLLTIHDMTLQWQTTLCSHLTLLPPPPRPGLTVGTLACQGSSGTQREEGDCLRWHCGGDRWSGSPVWRGGDWGWKSGGHRMLLPDWKLDAKIWIAFWSYIKTTPLASELVLGYSWLSVRSDRCSTLLYMYGVTPLSTLCVILPVHNTWRSQIDKLKILYGGFMGEIMERNGVI